MLPIGVLLPTRNSISRLALHLESCLPWLDQVEQVVVVDSFSTDGTIEFLKANLRHKNLEILTHPPGLYQSWNHGIGAIQSKYTYVSTIGDTITRAGLEHLAEAAERLQSDVLVSPPAFEGDVASQMSEIGWPIHHIIRHYSITEPYRLNSMDAFIAALYFSVFKVLQGILGSSASNLYRTASLQSRPFVTDAGSPGDVVWGVENALDVKFGVTPVACATFLFHPPTYTPNSAEINDRLMKRIVGIVRRILEAKLAMQPCEDRERLLAVRAMLDLQDATKRFEEQESALRSLRRRKVPWILRPDAWNARKRRDECREHVRTLLTSVNEDPALSLWQFARSHPLVHCGK